MMNIGDIVCRKKYNKDIFFEIVDIKNNNYILRGIEYRLIADSEADDLEIADFQRTFDKFNIDSSVNFTIPIYVFLSNFYSDVSIPPIYKTMNQSIHLTTCRCIIFSDFIIYIICKFFVSTKHTNI